MSVSSSSTDRLDYCSTISSPSSSSTISSTSPNSGSFCNDGQIKAFESFDVSDPSSNSFDSLAEEVVKDSGDEIGKSAFWSVSSAKPGLGVENLRDGNVLTFWQSDSEPPHFISIQFQRLTTVTVTIVNHHHR